MKKNWKNQYFMWGLTALITIILAFCFYYLMFMGQNLIHKMQFLLRIIMPVIDGLAIAYIASPILNTIEYKIIFPLCDRLKIDIKKLQVKQNELYKNLGEKVSKFLSEEIIDQLGIDNPAEKENILSIQNEIIELEKQIQQKQSEL